MVTLQMMQFTAVVLMVLLTVKLLFLRGRHIKSRQPRQARRLMTGGTMLLSLHFAIQLNTGLRLMGITQSVMLNLAKLIPASHLFARAILLLQRRGELSLADRWTGPAVWTVTMAMLAVAFAIYFLMFYLVDSFCFYLTSPAPERIRNRATDYQRVKCQV